MAISALLLGSSALGLAAVAARARTSAPRMGVELAQIDAPSTPSMPPPLKDADDFTRGVLDASGHGERSRSQLKKEKEK